MAQTDLLDTMGCEIYKDNCLKPSAFDLRQKKDIQTNPRSCTPICWQRLLHLWTRRRFIGYRGSSEQEFCSELFSLGWYMSDPHSNSRMAGSLVMFVTRREIPSPSGFSQENLENILSDWYVQSGLESWDLHQREVYPQPAKNPVLCFLTAGETHFL